MYSFSQLNRSGINDTVMNSINKLVALHVSHHDHSANDGSTQRIRKGGGHFRLYRYLSFLTLFLYYGSQYSMLIHSVCKVILSMKQNDLQNTVTLVCEYADLMYEWATKIGRKQRQLSSRLWIGSNIYTQTNCAPTRNIGARHWRENDHLSFDY